MKKLPITLVVGGIAIGCIAYFGYKEVNRKSSEEVLLEMMHEQRVAEQKRQEELAALVDVVLEAPATCGDTQARVFFSLCDLEPDEGYAAPNWIETGLTSEEQQCVADAFHATNEHVYKISGETYTPQAPESEGVILFACDVSRATLFTDGISFGEDDAPATVLLNGFYADRAGQRFQSPYD